MKIRRDILVARILGVTLLTVGAYCTTGIIEWAALAGLLGVLVAVAPAFHRWPKTGYPALEPGERVYARSEAILILPRPDLRRIATLARAAMSLTTVGNVLLAFGKLADSPGLEFQPIGGMLYLTSRRILFEIGKGQPISRGISIHLGSISSCSHYSRLGSTFLTVETAGKNTRFSVPLAEGWCEAITQGKEKERGKKDCHAGIGTRR